MDIVIIGLLLGGTYALMAMGLQLQYGVARIMNLANGEILIAGAFSTFWFYSGDARLARCSRCSWSRPQPLRELGDLPRSDLAAGPPRQEPGQARGRQHPGDLRHQLHRRRHSARDLRRRISELFLSGASRSSFLASATGSTASWPSLARRRCAPASISGCTRPAQGSRCGPFRSTRRRPGCQHQCRARLGARLCAGRSGDGGRAARCSACS